MLLGQAGSVGELLAEVKRVSVTWSPTMIEPQELWFRGQPRAGDSLLPALYRSKIKRLNYDEVALFERFKVFANPHVRRPLSNDWDWYFLAQHYGLPTRLLDWTESLLAAAYFAVCESILCHDRLLVDQQLASPKNPPFFDDESPVVWVVDAGTVNRAATGEDFPFVPGGEFTGRYLPDQLGAKAEENRLPIALLPPRANERIAAQHGVFTIHGHCAESLDSLAVSATPRILLAKILLDRANLSSLWEELQLAGVSRYSLFPGIDTAAEHVRWIMQSANPVASA
jgi:hypothetical protein